MVGYHDRCNWRLSRGEAIRRTSSPRRAGQKQPDHDDQARGVHPSITKTRQTASAGHSLSSSHIFFTFTVVPVINSSHVLYLKCTQRNVGKQTGPPHPHHIPPPHPQSDPIPPAKPPRGEKEKKKKKTPSQGRRTL